MSTEARIWGMLEITAYVCAVSKVCAQLGWLQADDADEWDVFWSDQSISLARAVAMQPMQVPMVAYFTLSLMHACGVVMLSLAAENQSFCWHAGAMPEEDTCTQHLSNGSTIPRTL